mgnify:CR=1 FL=1
MTNDERDVLHHIDRVNDANLSTASVAYVLFHIGAAIALAILEVARAIRSTRS